MKHVLIFKNQKSRRTLVYRTGNKVHLFDTIEEAAAIGQQMLAPDVWDAFHTMDLETFLDMCVTKLEGIHI